MKLFQDERELGRVKHFRLLRSEGVLRCIFEVTGQTAVDLDTETTAVLEESDGKRMVFQPSKSFYSWGSFRVHGIVVEEEAPAAPED